MANARVNVCASSCASFKTPLALWYRSVTVQVVRMGSLLPYSYVQYTSEEPVVPQLVTTEPSCSTSKIVAPDTPEVVPSWT